jgi:hypothetical protein
LLQIAGEALDLLCCLVCNLANRRLILFAHRLAGLAKCMGNGIHRFSASALPGLDHRLSPVLRLASNLTGGLLCSLHDRLRLIPDLVGYLARSFLRLLSSLLSFAPHLFSH